MLSSLAAVAGCGSPRPTSTSPVELAVASAAITSTAATNDAATVTYAVAYTGSHQFFRVYVDADQRAATGFAYAGIGAEFLVENQTLYRYTGSGADWSWAAVQAVTFTNAGGKASWTVPRSALGETAPCGGAADLVFDVDDAAAPVVHQALAPTAACAQGSGGSGGTGGSSSTSASAGGAPDGGPTSGMAGLQISNDATTAEYAFDYAGAPAYWRVYLDTDRAASTGFAAGAGVGADFLIEGGRVYRYAGPGWSWTAIGSATFSATAGTARWSVARALIGETAPCGQATLLFQTQDGAGALTSSGAIPQTFADAACSAMDAGSTGGSTGGGSTASGGGHTRYVFVIAFENEAAGSVYGSSSAPYLNGQLIPRYAHATAFADPLPDALPSEPHYVWMEAGTNAFADATFTTDADPSAGNSTASTAHLATQMMAQSPAVSWLSFQEGLSPATTGACPIHSAGFFAAKHDPFVFFQDLVGRTPSATSSLCAAHHQAYTTAGFAQALAQGTVAQYDFITPNLCNDMHGASGCPTSDLVAAGDGWLAANLPPIIQFANANDGVIFLVWDEPEGGSPLIPFLAIGPDIKPGYISPTAVTHSALVKTVERIFGLPVLPAVAGANDFGDMFQPGTYP
ncbi:MAG TPA: alkaline phosphatase family protein [Polyangia bacterium]|nr:alkaline phosphatase family protein [Polyangia bacterium]